VPIVLLLGGAAALLLLLSGRARGLVEDATDAGAAALGADMLSPHFSLHELCVSSTAARLKISNLPTSAAHRANLVWLANDVLEPLRALCGDVPITVTSGYRSAVVNTAIGGSTTSDHMQGLAADLYVSGLDADAVAALLAGPGGASIPFDQIIVERHTGHLHLGAGPRQRRDFLETSDGATYTDWSGLNA
jgi:hypothetical protein